jgi:hypothetical protein
MTTCFAVIGDPHCDVARSRLDPKKVLQQCVASNVRVLLVCGDLTEHGYGTAPCVSCVRRTPDELGQFICDFFTPFEARGIRVLCCPGNHDTYCGGLPIDACRPVFRWLGREYGDPHFYAERHEGIIYVSCGIYPGPSTRTRLQQFCKDTLREPKVLFWHYNPRQFHDYPGGTGEHEPFSDWIPDAEHRAIAELCLEFKEDIVCVCTGHVHATWWKKWYGIRRVSGSDGRDMAIVKTNGAWYAHVSVRIQ